MSEEADRAAAAERDDVLDAAGSGDLPAVRHFVRQNRTAALSAKNGFGETALLWAAWQNHDDVVHFLIEAKADLDVANNDGATALHIAAFNGHLHTAELLVAAGASLDVKDKKGMTPLDLARQFKEQEVVKLLESAAQKKVEAATGGYAAEAKPSAALIGAKGEVPAGHGKKSEQASTTPESIVDFPDGSRAPVSMFSARFDGSEMEQKFRKVHELLVAHKFDNLMVSVSGGGDFGEKTLEYLGRLDEERGVMLAVCTENYGEMTDSEYSSNRELKFALDQKLHVIPLRVVEMYPPRPPFGLEHPFDKTGTAKTLVKMVLPPSKVYLDCRNQSAEQIARLIADQLLAKAK